MICLQFDFCQIKITKKGWGHWTWWSLIKMEKYTKVLHKMDCSVVSSGLKICWHVFKWLLPPIYEQFLSYYIILYFNFFNIWQIGLQILPYSLFHMNNVHTPQWSVLKWSIQIFSGRIWSPICHMLKKLKYSIILHWIVLSSLNQPA